MYLKSPGNEPIFDPNELNRMGQEDYLKRQLDQLGRVLSKMLTGLLGLKDKTTLNSGIDQVNQNLKAELGFTSGEFALLENDELIRILETEKHFSNPHFEKLANLFLFIADHTSETEKRKMLYEKCLVIFHKIDQAEKTYSYERQVKVSRITKLFNEL